MPISSAYKPNATITSDAPLRLNFILFLVMKLRIEDNSLRLRLSADEVAQFATAGRVAAVVHLGLTTTDSLTYALERAENEEFRVTYGAGALTVKVPAALANHWTTTEENGLYATLMVAEDQPLKIVIEKDLDCLH